MCEKPKHLPWDDFAPSSIKLKVTEKNKLDILRRSKYYFLFILYDNNKRTIVFMKIIYN